MSADQRIYLKGFAGSGVGLFIYQLADQYFKWVLSGIPSDRPTWETIAAALGVGICAGLLSGLFSAIQDARAKLDDLRPNSVVKQGQRGHHIIETPEADASEFSGPMVAKWEVSG